jgi:hypothetical protein
MIYAIMFITNQPHDNCKKELELFTEDKPDPGRV